MSKNPVFTIDIDATFDLSADEVWPDGDAPENPTASDVIAVIQRRHSRVGSWITDWNLDRDVRVFVDGERVFP